MKISCLYKNIKNLILKLVVILLSFCAFNIIVKAGNLSSLEVVGYETDLNPSFNSTTYDYSINIPNEEIDLNFNYTKENVSDEVVVSNNLFLKNSTGTVTIDVSGTIYTINYTKINGNINNQTFSYSGSYNTFTVPLSGDYKIELWGAQGGNGSSTTSSGGLPATAQGGKGGYTSGIISEKKGQNFYVYVGGTGSVRTYSQGIGNSTGGWNGGANGYTSRTKCYKQTSGGGGATDIRIVEGSWDNLTSLTSRIMVAGGGGGIHQSNCGSGDQSVTNGGHAGGVNGRAATYSHNRGYSSITPTGGTQTTGGRSVDNWTATTYTSNYIGSFGKGGLGNTNYYSGSDRYSFGGGGSGYYGGASGGWKAGGGGSSYVSGFTGAVAVIAEGNTTPRNSSTGAKCADGTTDNLCSIHYSQKVFKSPVIKAGDETMPTQDGSSTMTGNTGNGYAKITYVPSKNKDNYLTNLTSDKGTFTTSFDSLKFDYTLIVDDYINGFNISGVLSNNSASVDGFQKYYFDDNDTKDINIIVTSESGDIKIYEIHAIRGDVEEHNTKLKAILINNKEYGLDGFEPLNYSYDIEFPRFEMYLDINAIPYDSLATVTIEGNENIVSTLGTITITVTYPGVETTVYEINYEKVTISTAGIPYEYNRNYQVFVAPYTTTYKIEAWGAQGGSGWWPTTIPGGKGAYTSGEIKLIKGEKLYIYTGGKGADNGYNSTSKVSGGTNGGGTGGYDTYNYNAPGGGGGGATDIRYFVNEPDDASLVWNSQMGLASRIMVAAGGGGGGALGDNDGSVAGPGIAGAALENHGYIKSYSLGTWTPNITQTTGYAFGYGQNGDNSYSEGQAGGGGGYYGGTSKINTSNNAGMPAAGGTSYISGYQGSVAIKSASEIEPRLVDGTICSDGTTNVKCSYHFTNKIFDKTRMLSGNDSIPTHDGSSTMTGNSGNGYVKITPILLDKNNYLSILRTDKGEWDKEFRMVNQEYTITLDDEDHDIIVSARPSSDLATIEGTGTYEIKADINNEPQGPTVIPITVTAESGDLRVYTLNITRAANTNPYPNDITISGLVPSYCAINENYCKQNPVKFNKNTSEYEITIPYKIKEIYFNVEKGHYFQTVSGEGAVKVNPNLNNFTITVTSEDGQNHSVYNYKVTRDMTGDNDLSKLNILYPTVEINFDPDVTEYYFAVTNNIDKYVVNSEDEYNESLENTMQLYYETDDTNAYAYMLGDGNLNVGQNKVQIMVVAQNGETQTYTLNVYREPNSNVYLKNLKVLNLTSNEEYSISPEFNKIFMGEYKTTVGKDIAKVNLYAEAESLTTTISGIGEKTLIRGENHFRITTTSQSGDTEVYTINIVREKDNNTALSTLKVKIDGVEKSYSPTFDKDELNYELTTAIGAQEVEIEATPEEATSTVKLLDNNRINVGRNVKRIEVKAEDGTTKIYSVTIIRPADNNNNLSTLVVYDDNENYVYNPIFDENETNYSLTVENEVSWINVLGTKSSNLAQISGNGRYNLIVGLNEIKVKVKAEDQTPKEYKVNITRKPNTNAYLKQINLSTGTLSPTFDKETLEYEVNVDANTNSITVEGIPEVTTTRVVGNRTYQLSTGDNFIELTTLAEDNTTYLTYKVTVIKAKSSNKKIRSLILKEGALTPSFNTNVDEYSAVVPYSKTQAHFIVELEDSRSSYEVINDDLVVGDNEVVVRVTSEDETTKDYKVNITRLDEETSRNTRLSSLTVDKGTLSPTFDPEELYYEVDLPYSDSEITIEAITEVVYSTVTGTGIKVLQTGENLFVIRVTSIDNYTRDYQIKVNRAKNNEARLSNVVIKNQTIEFDKDTYEYNVTTKKNSLEFTSIVPIDNHATYEIIGNSFSEVGNYVVKIKVTAENGIATKEYKFNVTRQESNNISLSHLEVEGYRFTQEFSPNRFIYELTSEVGNEVNNVNVIASTEDRHSRIEGDGIRSLNVGLNEIKVKVIAEDDTEEEYIIKIRRRGSSNNNLLTLDVLNGIMSPVYSNETGTYNVEIPYEESTLDIRIILEDETATYQVVGNSSLPVGQSLVKVLVTAEDGSIRTINLNVNRKEIVSALLKTLKIRNYEILPEFEKNTFSYEMVVNNEVDELEFEKLETLDPNATYVVRGNENLSVGNNIVEIEVTASDNVTKQIYTINVSKQIYVNNFLSTLEVEGYEIEPIFNKNIMEYSLVVPETIENVIIEGTAEDSSSTVTGLGEQSLSLGENKFIVSVVNSGIRRNYIVRIIREEENSYLSSLQVKVGNTVYPISPEFDKEETNYSVTVPASTESVIIEASAMHEASRVEGTGTKTINLGEKTLEVTCISKSGRTKVYKVKVIRPASNDVKVTNIIPSSGVLSPTFDETTKTYSLHVGSNVESISFNVTTRDKNAHISGNESQVLPVGESQRIITILAEDNTTEEEYRINITRDRTDNAYLSNLYINGYTFEETFNEEVYEYHVTVPNAKVTLSPNDVVAISSDPNAKITKQETISLSTKEINEYLVTVKSYDDTKEKTYKIYIEREKSDLTLLDSLSVDKGRLEPTFTPTTREYDLYVYENEEGVNIDATPANEDIQILSGTGNIALMSDEIEHKIMLQAENGDTGFYTINIHKSIKIDKGLSNLGLNYDSNLEHIESEFVLSPEFNENTLTYNISVPYEYKKLDVLYELSNNQQSVKLKIDDTYIENNTYELPLGETPVQVEVYDGLNQLTRTYTLNVTRNKSRNTYLSSLEIDGYELSPEFNKYTQEYTIRVPSSVTDLELSQIIAIPEEATSHTVISGYRYLLEGVNDMDIEVISASRASRSYIVHVIRGEDKVSDLKNITVSTGVFHEISPKFKKDVYDYTVRIPSIYNKATVEAVVDDSTLVTIDGIGEYDLVVGNNIVTLISTSTITGQVSTYTVNIIKEADEDVDLISLSALEGTLSPIFNRGNTKYEMIVPNDVDKLTLSYQTSSSLARVIVTGNENLRSGANKVNVVVTNPEGTKSKTYQILVTKAKNSNTKLSEIKVTSKKGTTITNHELTPEINEEDRTYDTTVNYDVEKVTIEATPEKETTNVSGDGEVYLNYGNNQIIITTTSEDGTVDYYYVNIFKNYNLNLSSLTVDKGELDPEFNKNEVIYTVEVEYEEKEITVKGTTEHEDSTVEGNGKYNLQVGLNEIIIKVKARDNTSKEYKVNVIRKADDNNYIKDLQVNGLISPVFEKTTEEYQVDVRPSVSTLDLNVELESSLATYEVIGNNLSQENNPNEVIIRVTSQSGKTRDYKLNTYVRDLSFFSNQLKDLTVSEGQLTPDFNPVINNYAVTVENSIDSIEVRTLKDNQYQKVKINGVVGSYRTIPLSIGRNEIKVEVINPSNTETNIYSIIVYRSATSDASLSNLVVEGHQFYPYYAKNIYEYDLDIESEEDNLNVIATPSDSNSKVEISGNNNIPPGRSEIRVKVTAPDNITTKEYVIKVNKVPSTNNYLSSLTVTDFELDKTFTKTDQGPYTINVGTNVTNINVKGIAESSKATVTGDGVKSLSKGRNEIQITVTSESGDARIYTLIVNRAYNDDAYLTNILLSDGNLDPEFNKNTFIYEVEVDESVEEVSVTGILSDNNASITGNDTYDLTENEETNVTLKVTAENSLTTKEYKIKFIRHVNASSYLSKLVVKNGELYPGFHKLITTYTILIPNEIRSLDMTYLPEDEDASVQVTGNQSFKVGTNKVHIIVTAKDNSSTTDYEISVVRQSKASNYLKSLEVTSSSDNSIKYELDPEFDRSELYYDVIVPVDVETVNLVAEAEDNTSTINANDIGLKTVGYGDNRFYIRVESLSGVLRTYSVNIIRNASENKLLTLESDKGVLSPEFSSTTKEYELRVPKGTSKVELTGTISENATVEGLGEVTITNKQQIQNIVVTSLSGETNTYQVNIIEEDGSDINLVSLTPSSGELDPEFSNNVNDYTIEVDDNVGTISFDVVPVDSKVKISGNSKTNLTYGENNITITVTSEDNSASKDIHIKVTRVKSLEKIVAEDTIVLGVNEEKDFEYTLIPNDATYKDVDITVADEDVAIIENNKVKGKEIGTTSIKIQSQKDSKVYKIINVSVINKLITSEVYEVVHFSEEELNEDSEGKDNYVIDLEPKTKIKDFLPNFENVLSTLSVYDKNGTKIEDENTTLGTGMKLKLIVEGQEYDHVTIIVRGDLNGDSIINVNDYKKLNNYILKTLTFNYIEKKASDLNKDNIVNVNDYKKLNNYVLKNISSVNPPRD